MNKKIFILLIVLFAAHLLFRIVEYRDAYLTPYNPSYWKQKYDYSQWSTKPACEKQDPHYNPFTCEWDDTWHAQNNDGKDGAAFKKSSIGDDTIYTYAGWEYIHGHDPTTLNAEVPPLGKYLIGLSEIIFKNQNIFALLSGIFVLVALCLLSKMIYKDTRLALLPVILLSFEPLFYTQLRAPFLDLLYLGFLLMTFYFFLKKRFILAGVFLGLMAATKSAVTTFPLVFFVMLLYLLITKEYKNIKKCLLIIPVSGFTFLLTYSVYFLQGNSLINFLGVQKWIINFYSSGAKSGIISPWEMVFTGKWHTWWGTYESITEWHVGWILLTLISGYALYKIIKQRLKQPIMLIGMWVVVYLIFLSFIPTWPRYLLLTLPFMYNLAIWVLSKGITPPKKI